MKRNYSNMSEHLNAKQRADKFLPELAKKISPEYPDVLEWILWELYWGEILGFNDDGSGYLRHSGDEIIPCRLIS